MTTAEKALLEVQKAKKAVVNSKSKFETHEITITPEILDDVKILQNLGYKVGDIVQLTKKI